MNSQRRVPVLPQVPSHHQHPTIATRRQRYEHSGAASSPSGSSGGGASFRRALAAYPAILADNNSPKEPDSGQWNLTNSDDSRGQPTDRGWPELEHLLAGGRFISSATLGRVGSCCLLAATAATTPTATTTVDALKATTFDLTNSDDDNNKDGHLLDTSAARLLPVARVYPIQPSIGAATVGVANGCPGRTQNDLLFSASSSTSASSCSSGRAAADTITATVRPQSAAHRKQRHQNNGRNSTRNDVPLAEDERRLDLLADKYLGPNDKLNLSYYLNEYQTNNCDLSELLANLIQVILVRLPNALIKYKLLIYVRRLYIGDIDCCDEHWPVGGKSIENDDDDDAGGAKSSQLDLLLFDTMLHQYLMASNALIGGSTVCGRSEAERKRSRRQRRALELANQRQGQPQTRPKQLAQPATRPALLAGPETSPSRRRAAQLRNLGRAPNGPAHAGQRWPTDNLGPPLDYCCASEFHQAVERNDRRRVVASWPSPCSASASASAPASPEEKQEAAAYAPIDVATCSAIVGPLPLAREAMNSSSPGHGYGGGGGDGGHRVDPADWHERNLLSSSVGSLALAADCCLPSSPLPNQDICTPPRVLFAERPGQPNHPQDEPSVFQASPSMGGRRVQIGAANRGPASCWPAWPPPIANQPGQQQQQQQAWAHHRDPYSCPSLPNQQHHQPAQSRGINSMAPGDGPASLAWGSQGGGRPPGRHFDTVPSEVAAAAGPRTGARGELLDDGPVNSIGPFDYEPLVSDDDYDHDHDNGTDRSRGGRATFWPEHGNYWPAANQRHLAGSSASTSSAGTGELLWPPAVGGRQQICQCDQCRTFAGSNSEPFNPTVWRPNQQQQQPQFHWRAPNNWARDLQHPFGQRSASVQNHQLGGPSLVASPIGQRCFSSMSVHYDQGQQQQQYHYQPAGQATTEMTTMMTPRAIGEQQHERRFVSLPPADYCGPGRLGPPRGLASQPQQRFAPATHSSLPSSPVGRRHYLQAAGTTTHRPPPWACCGADGRGLALGGGPEFTGQQQQHQSIQLKDWPASNSLAGPLRAPEAGPRGGQTTRDHQRPQTSPAARSATIKDNTYNGVVLGRSWTRKRPGQQAAIGAGHRRAREQRPPDGRDGEQEEDDQDEDEEDADEDFSGDECALVPLQAKGKLPLSVAEQMERQASNFVHQYGSANSRRSRRLLAPANGGLQSGSNAGNLSCAKERRKPDLLVRRTLPVKIKKSKPILGIAIEGGFNVSGQLLPRVVCVHEDGAAYQCGKLRASDLILEVNGSSTVNMTHDQIAKLIATAYYQDPRPYIEFLIGESVHA